MSGFRITGSTRLADTGFLALDRVDVEGHGESFTRTVVRHPGAVVVVPVVGPGTVVLVRQYRAATAGDLLEVPAGKRDADGEPPERTAARELEEEIGYRPGELVKVAEFWNSPGFCDEYSHVFVALGLELVGDGAGAPTSPEERTMTNERVELAHVEALVSDRRLVDGKSIISLLLARQYLAGEHRPIGP